MPKLLSWLCSLAFLSGCALAQAQGNSDGRGNAGGAQRGQERAAERAAERALEAAVNGRVEKKIAKGLERQLAREGGAAVAAPQARGSAAEQRLDRSARGRVAFEIERDQRGFPRVRHRWLILTDAGSLAALRGEGFEVASEDSLSGLDAVLAEVVAPPGAELSAARRASFELLSSELQVDYDHLFSANSDVSSAAEAEWVPRSLMPVLPEFVAEAPARIGVLDSAVDLRHPCFGGTQLRFRDFAEGEGERPAEHGTAIASIFLGRDGAYQGLLPAVDLYSAGVFFDDPRVGQRATVKSLVLGLNWLAQQKVDVINVSLTGPENLVLGEALRRLDAQGIAVVAAVGNEGPTAAPLYPAAYDFVVAVTATNTQRHAYFKAGRGAHVDIAAPGVDIRHARAGGGYHSSSGTSFAAPFVSAYLAAMKARARGASHGQLLADMYRQALDLGERGRDEVYGFGLLPLLNL